MSIAQSLFWMTANQPQQAVAFVPTVATLVHQFVGGVSVTESDGEVQSWASQGGGVTVAPAPSGGHPTTGLTPSGMQKVIVGEFAGMTAANPPGLPTGAEPGAIMLCARFPVGEGFFAGAGYGSNVATQSRIVGVDGSDNFIADYRGGRVTGGTNTGEWVTLLLNYNGTTLELYEDGVRTGFVDVVLDTGTDLMNVAISFGGDTTQVEIAEMRFYDGALTQAEITTLHTLCSATYFVDLIPPGVFASLENPTDKSVDYSLLFTEDVTLDFVLTNNETRPNQTQIGAGQDHLGATALSSVLSASLSLGLSTATLTVPASTDIWGHGVAVDGGGNITSFSTPMLRSLDLDTVAPIIAYSGNIQTTSTGGTINWTTDEGNGTVFAYYSDNASETKEDVVANAQFSDPVTSTGAQSLVFQGITASTTKTMHIAQRDLSGNISDARSQSFTTNEATASGVPMMESLLGFKAYIPNIIAADYPATRPTATRFATAGTFAAEYAAASNGDVIQCADGAYSGYTIEKEITIVSENLHGAEFSHLYAFRTSNVTIQGVKVVSKLSCQGCDFLDVRWNRAERMDISNRPNAQGAGGSTTPVNNTTVVEYNIVGPDGPITSGSNVSSFGQIADLTMRYNIFIHADVDSMKLRGIEIGTIEYNVIGHALTQRSLISNGGTHPDSMQSDVPCRNLTVRFNYVGSDRIGTVDNLAGGQGWFARGIIVVGTGPVNHESNLIEQNFFSGGYNSNAEFYAHSGRTRNCTSRNNTTLGLITAQNPELGNTITDSICESVRIDEGKHVGSQVTATKVGVVEYGSNVTSVMEMDHAGLGVRNILAWTPKAAYSNKGANVLLATIQSRMASAAA